MLTARAMTKALMARVSAPSRNALFTAFAKRFLVNISKCSLQLNVRIGIWRTNSIACRKENEYYHSEPHELQRLSCAISQIDCNNLASKK